MFAVRYNLWNLGSLFFLGLGIILPVIVAALFVARRVSPGTKIRIGSLSVDQFGSVVASFAVAFFFLSVAGAFVPSMLLALVGALGLLAATVLARLIPFFAGDFLDRAEVPAHVVARDSAVPVRKPRAPKAPKEAKDDKAPKAAGTSAVAGWAKRMTPGGQSAATEHGPAWRRVVRCQERAPLPPRVRQLQLPVPRLRPRAAAQGKPAPNRPPTKSLPRPPAPPRSSAPRQPRSRAPFPRPPRRRPPPSGPRRCRRRAVGRRSRPQAAAVALRPPSRPRLPPSCLPPLNRPEPQRFPRPPSHSAPTTVNPQVRQQEPIGATVDPASRPEEHDAQPATRPSGSPSPSPAPPWMSTAAPPPS